MGLGPGGQPINANRLSSGAGGGGGGGGSMGSMAPGGQSPSLSFVAGNAHKCSMQYIMAFYTAPPVQSVQAVFYYRETGAPLLV